MYALRSIVVVLVIVVAAVAAEAAETAKTAVAGLEHLAAMGVRLRELLEEQLQLLPWGDELQEDEAATLQQKASRAKAASAAVTAALRRRLEDALTLMQEADQGVDAAFRRLCEAVTESGSQLRLLCRGQHEAHSAEHEAGGGGGGGGGWPSLLQRLLLAYVLWSMTEWHLYARRMKRLSRKGQGLSLRKA